MMVLMAISVGVAGALGAAAGVLVLAAWWGRRKLDAQASPFRGGDDA